MKDLTVSNIERQNVLNNNYALQAIQENLDVNGLRFHDQLLFTTKMVAEFYGVDERTIKRYVQEHGDKLRANGYFLSEGNSLKELKLHFVGDINVPKFSRQLGIFSFRIITCYMANEDYPEALKLEIIHAIDNDI